MIIKMAACNCAFRFANVIEVQDVTRAVFDYNQSFITTIGMFTDFIANVRYTHSKIHEVMEVLQPLWVEYENIVPITVVRDELRKKYKHFNITDRAMNHIFTVMDNGNFIIWARGVGKRKGNVVNPEEDKEQRELSFMI